jgi:hypothetical protein
MVDLRLGIEIDGRSRAGTSEELGEAQHLQAIVVGESLRRPEKSDGSGVVVNLTTEEPVAAGPEQSGQLFQLQPADTPPSGFQCADRGAGYTEDLSNLGLVEFEVLPFGSDALCQRQRFGIGFGQVERFGDVVVSGGAGATASCILVL